MPHDKYGTALKVGDRVRMEFTVLTVAEGSDFCNVTLVRDGADEQYVQLTCQATQVEKVPQQVTQR